jgi:hypothetical protein
LKRGTLFWPPDPHNGGEAQSSAGARMAITQQQFDDLVADLEGDAESSRIVLKALWVKLEAPLGQRLTRRGHA